MKYLTIVGIALAVLGAYISLKDLSYGSQRSVIKVGDVRVSAESQRVVPPWIGWVAIVGGISLISAGARPRRSIA